MKSYYSIKLAALIAVLFIPFRTIAADEDFVFTYDHEDSTHDLFGIQRIVQIDAAMLLKDPSLVGSEILGISVDIPSKEGCECSPNASAWLSKTLQVEGEFNRPDIQEAEGTIKNYGTDSEPQLKLDIMFQEPYKVTEEGVYVGYSVSVTSCNVPGSGWTAKYPIVTVCNIDKPESFMIHCTKGKSEFPQKYPEWTDLSTEKHQALAMKVLMRGNRMANAAALEPLHTLYSAPGNSGPVYINLNNYGTEPISSIEYTYSIESDGVPIISITKDLDLEIPIQGLTGAYTTLDLPFEAPEVTGKYSAAIRVDKVNNQINEYKGASVLDVEVLPFLPVNHPLVEDYTGQWCGYCPAVYVAVCQMHDKYGEDFLTIAYHLKDKIHGVKTSDLPSQAPGLPRVYMKDRNEQINYDNLEQLWLRQRRELAPADIDVDIYWTDADHTALRAESTIRFVYDNPDADYMVTYAMVEDNMSDPYWTQANEYMESDFEGPYWDLFCGQPFRVVGLVYDDVILNFPSAKGIEGSLPSFICGEKEYHHSSVLELKDAVCKYEHINNYGESIIKNPDKLRIVALLIDGKTGEVCNSSSSGYSGNAGVYDSPEGVETIQTDVDLSKVIFTEYLTLDGIRLSSIPDNRPVTVVSHMADGSIHTEKRMK